MRIAEWWSRRGCMVLAGAVVVALSGGDGFAAETCAPLFGRLISIDGQVEVQRAGQPAFRAAALNETLCRDDTVRVGKRSRAAISLVNDAVMRLDQDTTLKLLSVSAKAEERSLFSLVLGAIQSFSRRPKRLAVNTPYLNATIEGTEFALRVSPGASEVTVFEGTVVAANDQGRAAVTRGQAAQARAGQAPVVRIVARPRDAVQWALYYPPVLTGGGPAVRRAAESLGAGRVDEARTEIDGAIARNEDAGAAHALRAVIKVVQNDADGALADARRAVELAPKAAAARIALSYALQAKFQLEEARAATRQAVADEPDNALAWARLAELHLSLGDRGDALAAAEKAVSLAPGTARAQTVLGFVALVFPKTETASAAFEKAIALASSAPLPRFGLGLAKIRQGDLEDGRKEIEAAVALDSNNALLRSYLGKAYFEEKRGPLDAQQLEIAKRLDPLDPTPYLYDAIRKQTENRPGEALTDLQQSIALNDNRAVYRGRMQLDQDRASRGTSLARVYNDLGYTQLGVNEATKSLTLDPSNASAHRFLSDNYRNVRRHEIARVSELLQAQLLQDININPVQPSVSSSNLNIVTSGGPATAGFNEFTPLFERNRARLDISGLAGNRDTYSGEGVASAVYDRFSVSAGAFRYKTDGFRDNNDLQHDIVNFYAQAALTPEINVQAEFRHKDTEAGELAFDFDRDVFNSTLRRDVDQDNLRLGLRYSPLSSTDFLFSYIHGDRKEVTNQDLPNGTNAQLGRAIDRGDQFEGQVQYRAPRFNVVAGGAYADIDRDTEVIVTVINDVPGVFLPLGCIPFVTCFINIPPTPAGTEVARPVDTLEDIKHERGYVYVNTRWPDPVTWTIGGSYDHFERGSFTVNAWNPKIGVQWDINDSLRFRAAGYKVMKPLLLANRTVEPTQVAGFNQLFDDTNATVSKGYAVGIDWSLSKTLSLGAEARQREYREPVNTGDGTFPKEDRDESIFRVYSYWSPIPSVAASLELVYDRYNSTSALLQEIPKRVDTLRAPATVRYFASSGTLAGTFASFGATFVNQTVDRRDTATLPEGTSTFFVLDLGFGYRLPDRRGIIGVQVANLLNRKFKYQDDNFREFRDDPTAGPFIPERTFQIRGNLNF